MYVDYPFNQFKAVIKCRRTNKIKSFVKLTDALTNKLIGKDTHEMTKTEALEILPQLFNTDKLYVNIY